MAGTRERFLLSEEGRRRLLGSGAIGCAAVGFLFAIAATAVVRFHEAGPAPSELLRPFLGFLGLLFLVLLGGLLVNLRPRYHVDVDVAAGSATIVRGDAPPRIVPLREAGPLRHFVEKRQVRSGKSWRTAVFHVVRPLGLDGVVVHESEDELAARRAAESRARAWGVPYVLPSGESRAPEELDVPLYQRLGGDEGAMAPLPAAPGSHLSVAWKEEGYEISSSYRPKVEWPQLAIRVLAPLALLGWGLWNVLPILVSRPEQAVRPDPFAENVFSVLAVGVFCAMLWLVVPAIARTIRPLRRSARPPTIVVSANGVRYRGRTVPLRAVEEVEPAPGAACRLVSDERILVVDADFCDSREHAWLRHELRRLVIETGQRLPAE